ncbi:hypothetical protein PMAYCL1PPCAC_10687, partial [Pristionchus mayeri]
TRSSQAGGFLRSSRFRRGTHEGDQKERIRTSNGHPSTGNSYRALWSECALHCQDWFGKFCSLHRAHHGPEGLTRRGWSDSSYRCADTPTAGVPGGEALLKSLHHERLLRIRRRQQVGTEQRCAGTGSGDSLCTPGSNYRFGQDRGDEFYSGDLPRVRRSRSNVSHGIRGTRKIDLRPHSTRSPMPHVLSHIQIKGGAARSRSPQRSRPDQAVRG